MTFDKFKNLALNPPARGEETIFEVTEYDVGKLPGRKRTHYPAFDVVHHRVGICHSLKEAESLMYKAIERAIAYDDEIYCFHIKEFPMGELLSYTWDSNGKSWRLYDGEGKLIDRTYCSGLIKDHNTEFGRYRGRPKDSFRFKAGDIVEVLDGDAVKLGVATGSGLSIEWFWELWLRIKKNEGLTPYINERRELTDEEVEEYYFPDSDDDQTPIIDGPGYDTHDHVHTLNIMPLRYPLPKRLRQRYEGYYRKMLKEENEHNKS